MADKRRQDENWVRPEADRSIRRDMRTMREDDIRTGRQSRNINDTGEYRVPQSRSEVRKKKKSHVGARIALFFVIFGVLAAIVAGVFAIIFFSTPDKIGSDMKYTYEDKTVKVDESLAYRDGRLYVSFTRIAALIDMTRVGDTETAKFVIADPEGTAAGTGSEEYAEFFGNDTKAFISGTEIRMSGNAVFSGDEVYVPADFVTLYMNGLTVTEDTDRHTVEIIRTKTAETDDEKKPIPEEITFVLKAAKPPQKIDSGELDPAPEEVTFTSDLSEYEKYMDPEDATPYLVLVNREHPADASLSPDDLVSVVNTRQDGRQTQQMRECAEKALEALYIEMNAAGYSDVSVTSGYRSYEYQVNLYASYVAQEMANDPSLTEEAAMAIVDTYSAKEGTSEHQTGLCCDMHNLPSADQAFAKEEVYGWLKENAWKFGFIERFPEGKEEITGYSFEPWHYRFVGRTAASAIHTRGICLEEYVG